MIGFSRYLLLFGDCIAFIVSILLVFAVRNSFFHEQLGEHIVVFGGVLVVVVGSFALWGLYDHAVPRNTYDLARVVCGAILWAAVVSIAFLYLLGRPHISPKINLVLLFSCFTILELCWRVALHLLTANPTKRALIIGVGSDCVELHNFFMNNPHVGFAIGDTIHPNNVSADELFARVQQKKISALIVQRRDDTRANAFSYLLESRWRGVELIDFDEAYEVFTKKISLVSPEPFDIAVHFSRRHHLYEAIKRPVEILLAFILLVGTAPFLLCIILFVKVTSKGSVLYRQMRTGLYGREFWMLKFRTMVSDAEKNGPQWSWDGDTRVTPIGRILRWSHLDELPQLINILKGDMSFVGPRPERPEFVAQLVSAIPLYDVRHNVKPGVTGWAQINFHYTASVEDAREKLQYDFYYIKNRNAVLDVLIVLRSVRFLFVNSSK
ncbi:MAG: exopolysaccharide biosynthesis polyprenyl glycosylphosphotransferase [bacterium]|nr:exopolysaccharide biosynthesis polyprenyl glycosylphosphotransferase [bacterium]